MHIGSTTLELKDDLYNMVGSYYSGRDRKNVGDIVITKTSRKGEK